MGSGSHSQALHPPMASLETLDWWEEREERTWTRTPDKGERPWSSMTESRRSGSAWSRIPARKVVKRERSPEPATPSLGSLRESPGLLLSPLHTIHGQVQSLKRKRSPRKPKSNCIQALRGDLGAHPGGAYLAIIWAGGSSGGPETCSVGNSEPGN